MIGAIMTIEAGEHEVSGGFPQDKIAQQHQAIVNRLSRRLIARVEDDEFQMRVRGGRLGLLATNHPIEVYEELSNRMRGYAIEIAVIRETSEQDVFIGDESVGVTIPRHVVTAVDTIHVTRHNQRRFALPEDIGVQIFPPQPTS